MSRRTAVDFTLRANITDLKSELGKVPGITEKEARKMAGAMEKNLLRAEKAAKKAAMTTRGDLAQAIGKAVQMTEKLATAAGVTEEQFEGLKNQAMQLGGRVDDFADQLGRADSSLSAVSGAVQHLNPEMAEAARMMGDAMGAAEGLILAAAQAPAAFTVSALAAGAFSLALAEVNEEMERNQREAERQEKIYKKLEKLTKNRTSIEHKLADAHSAQTDALFVSTRAHEENEKAIAAEVARANQLARANEGIRYQRIAEETRAWAQRQRQLNDELLEFEQQAKRNQFQLQQQETQYRIIELATADRITHINRLADAHAQAGNKIHAAELAASAATMQTHAAVMAVVEAREKEERGLYETAEAQKNVVHASHAAQEAAANNFGALRMGAEAYRDQIKTAEALEKQLEKLTGQEFQLFDATGALITSSETYGKTVKSNREPYQRSVILANLDTQAALELNDATILKIKLQNEAAKNRKKQAEESAAAAAAELQATITALDAEVEKRKQAAAASIDAMEVEKLSSAEKIDRAEQEALAELDILRQKFEAQEALTVEKVAAIEAAETMIRQQADMERANLTAEQRAKEIEEFEKMMAAKSALIVQTAKEEVDTAKKTAAINETIQADLMAATSELFATGSQFMMDQAEERSKHDRKLAMRDFRISKALATSEAIINAAGAINTIWDKHAANPIVAGALTALTSAVTGAQIAKIVSQEPSFDVGGVIAPSYGGMARTPDQVRIRALPGEAVLNRQAVDRLGADGVDRLNSGAAAPVVVRPVSTFKHFDRFTKSEFRRAGYFRSLFDQDREFAPGQRSY